MDAIRLTTRKGCHQQVLVLPKWSVLQVEDCDSIVATTGSVRLRAAHFHLP